MLLLPAGAPVELTCLPEPSTGRSRALEVALFPEAFSRWVPVELGFAPAPPADAAVRRLGHGALTALVHFCEAVVDPVFPPRMLEHELEGVLLALMLEGAGEAPAELLDGARVGPELDVAVRQIVRAVPDAQWRLGEIARKLGVSEATLRRRLSSHGTGLRRIVHEERMTVARSLLAEGRLNVAEVAFHCGYESPAKFSQQFKRSFGVLPSAYRRGSLPSSRADRARN
jgi:AraC-like DNA-binding protein